MTSQKQRIANRRNSLLSSGPRTEDGQRRSALNALKHGLTAPIESTSWCEKMEILETLLKTDGLNPSQANELAKKMLDYERNTNYQRNRLRAEMKGGAFKPVISQEAQNSLDISKQIELAFENKEAHEVGMDRQLARDTQKFFEKIANAEIRSGNRNAVQELKNADRYMRRAANQLIRQLKTLSE